MGKEALREAILTYSELLRVHQLNIELLDALEQTFFHIQSFCHKHHIPFHDEKLNSAITRIDSLLEEINCEPLQITVIKSTDDSLHPNEQTKTLQNPYNPSVEEASLDTTALSQVLRRRIVQIIIWVSLCFTKGFGKYWPI